MINKNLQDILNWYKVGKQSCLCDYKDTTNVTIKTGLVHINDGTVDDIFEVKTEFDVAIGSPTASTWCFVMVSAPSGVGYPVEITSSNISISETVPELDEEKRGYYDSATGTTRCIGFFYSNGSSQVTMFEVYENSYRFLPEIELFQNQAVGTSYGSHTIAYVPFNVSFYLSYHWDRNTNTACFLKWSFDGTNTYSWGGHVTTNKAFNDGCIIIPMKDASKRFWVLEHASTANDLGCWLPGFEVPLTIYNG